MDGDGHLLSQHPLSATSSEQLQSISDALNATLNPQISNQVREQALQFLEEVKKQPHAPQSGFTLADDWKQGDAVRYYGLQLLEHAVRYRWAEYNLSETEQLRTWIKFLAGSARDQDALFLRNKIAQLWVEVAKRCWGDEWMDMDANLVTLWNTPITEKGTVNKVLVLYVLESLSEDIILNEDAVAGLRLEVLGQALNEIMVPQQLYEELKDARGGRQETRSAEEGWVERICDFFSVCVKYGKIGDNPDLVKAMSASATKALNALRPTMTWINLNAAVMANCIDCLFLPFHTEDVQLRKAATEVLYALLNRSYNHNWNEAWMRLVQQALHPDHVALIRHAFEECRTSPGEDDEKYSLQKKLSEVVSVLADALARRSELAAAEHGLGMDVFFDLLQQVLLSKSLTVSIPALHSFTKLMTVQDNAIIDLVFGAFGNLVQTCSARLIRYESMGEDSNDETVQFLFEDFDTMPERHAFLGNYRRYCNTVIQSITRARPLEALSHVLGGMQTMLETGPHTGARGFNSENYTKNDLSVLRFDAQYQVVQSALKGYSAWLVDMAQMPPESELHARAANDRANTTSSLQQWCYNVINIHTDDPEVAAEVLETLVTILRTITPEPAFVLHVVQHLLTMRLYDNPDHTIFSDAVKSFESLRVIELQKLALAFSHELLEVYHELEPRIGVLAQKHSDDPRLVWGYRAFLFMIIHRAFGINKDMRMARLQTMLEPVYKSWQDMALTHSLSSLDVFCASLGMGDLAEFYKAYHFDQQADWSSMQLDEAGKAKMAKIKTKNDDLPLRMTKAMMAATTEKLRSGKDEHETAFALWGPIIPMVLPNLLKMLRHAQAFHNLENWGHLPDELQAVVKRTMQDRFWQSGISNESKDEFYARISGSKTSYEGFASVVRGTMRNVREQGYHILFLMTKFDDQFYGLPDLAAPLSEALFADAGALFANHLQPIINLATGLVSRCPPHHRPLFLPPLLKELFEKIGAKISSEWELIGLASETNREDDVLSDEMRTESVLRALTYSMVTFVTFLLDFDRPEPPTNGHAHATHSLRDLVLSDPTVLEPLILFCTHALRMRDTRCCVMICKVFRSMVPLFQRDEAPAPQVREFISTEVLKACIRSLNEPYFVDMQKDLAMLIAQILLLYSPKTGTPRDILLSLPNMSATKVETTIERICKSTTDRQQRALVLDLLDGVRGVSIHEQGKLTKEAKRGSRTRARQQQYMDVEPQPRATNGNDEMGLDGVAGLFSNG